MRHQMHGRTLSRRSGHRDALLSNLVCSVLEHEQIKTTDAKAKEIRRYVDRAINWSVSLGEILTKDEEKLDAEDRARRLHHIRMARRIVKNPETLRKLFHEIGPRFLGRPGGYTRVLKLGARHGDAAPTSIVELVERVKKEPPAKPAKKAEAQAKE